MASKVYPLQMEIAGNTAIWTRPDTGDSPCSYPAPTYSAVKALFESVLWGPDVLVEPVKAEICSPIRYHSYATNYGGPQWDRRTTSPGHAYQEIFNRRLTRGQSFASLSLGWREFTPSYFGPFREGTKVCSEIPDIVIPSMLREVFPAGYRSDWRAVYDTNLVIHQGVLIYPERGRRCDQ